MGKWLALAGIALATGCNYGAGTFRCTDDNQCGAAGRCEPGNLCSSPSPICESGRAYSDLSGPRAGECVEAGGPGPVIDSGVDAIPIDAIPIDAPPDAPPDATACFGTDIVRICLNEAPSAPFTVTDLTTINTDDPSSCAPVVGGSPYCVIAATDIVLDARLRATGTKPLVLLASGSITSAAGAVIDVGSHRIRAGGSPETGAGADPSTCAASSRVPSRGGGGAGGSMSGTGGIGGNGDNAPNTGGTAGAAVSLPIMDLRGGCAGQDGDGGTNDRGGRGHGGGAVFLIAGSRIELNGGIDAAGEGGLPGLRSESGGGGGGAGGMIGFDAPTITATGLLLANGGAGAEGSGTMTAGAAGADSTTIAPAVGGAGNTGNGGDGGAGSSGAAAGSGAPGQQDDGGGGGGGGGAGLIKAPATANLGTNVSPAPTP